MIFSHFGKFTEYIQIGEYRNHEKSCNRTVRRTTAVINASLYGAVKAFRESGADGHVLGMINGIEGFLADHVMDLSTDLSNKELELPKLTRLITWFLPL